MGDYFLFGDVASGDWISPSGDADWTRMSKRSVSCNWRTGI